MATESQFRCMRCRTITEQSQLDNRQWFGWRYIDGVAVSVPVNNYCCPECGSNDLVEQCKKTARRKYLLLIDCRCI